MVDNTTAVATVNMAMLDRAEADSSSASVMSCIHKLKIYNPAPGTDADPAKANKYILIEANTGNEILLEGEINFTPLAIGYQYTGKIYPTLEDWSISDDEVSFNSSEFGKFDKKIDTIGISAKGKPWAFFTKGEFEKMIKCPMLNGTVNQFYEKKKDKDGVPYHGTLLRKIGVIYGQFNGGQYDKEYFRMFTSPNNIGITYDAEAWAAVEADEGTLEYVTIPGLQQMNDIRTKNGKKAITRVAHDQCDVTLSIHTNTKGNFMPVFTFVGLVAMRGYDNEGDVKFIHDLRAEQFRSIFWQMGAPTFIVLDWTKAGFDMPKMIVAHTEAIEAPKQVATAKDAEDLFGDAPHPTVDIDDNF